MARFTDIFIQKPVLSTVISLLIFVLGLNALIHLPIQQFPKLENTVITVRTSYPGASASVIEGFISSPIEKLVASADGVDYITSDSTLGVSTVTAYIKLNFDPNAAFTSVSSQAAQAKNQLPRDAEPSVIQKTTGSQVALMYIGFNSEAMTSAEIADYISRVIQPQLQTISGVSQVQILGSDLLAMRIWLDPNRMAALHITPEDITQSLQNNNFISAAGSTKGELVAYAVNPKTNLHSVKGFEEIVIKNDNSAIVYLKEVADIELGSESYDSNITLNGKSAVFLSISATPTANPLTIINQIRNKLPALEQQFPPSLYANIVYDVTEYIRGSMHEVARTIIEAAIIVILVIFAFLGSIRSVLIPVVTIPLSLIGVCIIMQALGFSINLLTLLAMVLAIGLVVDDAIIVVENVHRHMEEGLNAVDAAILGAREIALPVISMTLTLAAVYAPIGFMGGLTGALFKEFAFTLASAVIISGIIALTLSPMMCSKFLQQTSNDSEIANFLDEKFSNLRNYYQKKLHHTLEQRAVVLLVSAIILLSIYFLYAHTSSELAPIEDQSVIFVQATTPDYANIDYATKFSAPLKGIFKSFSETKTFFIINGLNNRVNTILAGTILKPWAKRKRSQDTILPILQNKINQLAGLLAVAFPLPPLPVMGNNLPIQFVITTNNSFIDLYGYSQKLLAKAQDSGLFIHLDSTLRIDNPQLNIEIDTEKAGSMGLSRSAIGSALSNALGGNYANYFDMAGQSYQVIPQLLRPYRYDPDEILNIYIKAANNQIIPLSTVAQIQFVVKPNNNSHFQQLNSTIIEGTMMPGKTLGDGLAYLQKLAKQTLPDNFRVEYAGQSRQYIQEGNTLIYTFFFAIIIIFLVLSAQFESFRDPIIILVTVPMSICGALIFLNLGFSTINIYTQVGLITLIGLISKHGILMVDFANHLKIKAGLSNREAIEQAAAIRLRPILMTTGAMILGLVPLLLASGAGAKSRFDIGLVIVSGMLIGTIFTLFVLPAIYTFVAKKCN